MEFLPTLWEEEAGKGEEVSDNYDVKALSGLTLRLREENRRLREALGEFCYAFDMSDGINPEEELKKLMAAREKADKALGGK